MPTITYIIQDCSRDLSQCTKINKEKKKKLGGGGGNTTELSFTEDMAAQKTPQKIYKLWELLDYLLERRTTYNNEQ